MNDTKDPDTETGKRFREVAEVLFDGNRSALARALDMKPGSFTKYLRGERTPGAAVLERITRLGVNINWFLTGEGPMVVPTETTLFSRVPLSTSDRSMSAAEIRSALREYHPVSLVQVRLAPDGELQLDEIGEPEWLSEQFIHRQYKVDPEGLRQFRVRSNRMADTIRAGDRVRAQLLSPEHPVEDLFGEGPYLLFGPGGVFVARVAEGEDEAEILLSADNPDVPDRTVPAEEWGDSIRPIARILEVIRPL